MRKTYGFGFLWSYKFFTVAIARTRQLFFLFAVFRAKAIRLVYTYCITLQNHDKRDYNLMPALALRLVLELTYTRQTAS